MKPSALILSCTLLVILAACDDAGGGKSDGATKNSEKSGASGDANGSGSLRALQVSAGWNVACALMSNGTVRCWGQNDHGETGGPPADVDRATPVEIAGITGAKDLEVGGNGGSGGDYGCATDGDGVVKCWGGRGIPVETYAKGEVMTVDALQGAAHISLGSGIGNAAMADGSMMSWGSNVFNALGLGSSVGRDAKLQKHPKVTDVAMVATGQNHGCALDKDGGVTCWGYSGKKQDPTPVAGITGATFIEAQKGGSETCAVLADKSVTCWGDRQEPKVVEGLTGVTSLSAQVQWCALHDSGKVSCWGSNGRGQVGNGEAGRSVSKPVEVAGISDAVDVAAGGQFSCAALASGAVKCWGWNARGQIGDGTLIDRLEPTEVKGLQAGTLAAPSDGAAKVWESDVEMSWDGIPAGCKSGGSLAMTSKNVEAKTLPIVSGYAERSKEGKTIKVSIANYKLDPAKLWEAPRGEQLMFSMRFAKVDLSSADKTPQVVDLGEYSMDRKKERLVYNKLTNKAHDWTLAGISLEGVDAGTVTITHLGDAWICGEAKVTSGKDSSVSGTWAARFHEK